MKYGKFESFEDLPVEGPALLHYAPFADLGCTVPTYWVPMMSRKVLCTRFIDAESGVESFWHMGCPYEELAQRWLEEALADLGPNRAFVSSLEIQQSMDRLN